jgi:hypothetical protein
MTNVEAGASGAAAQDIGAASDRLSPANFDSRDRTRKNRRNNTGRPAMLTRVLALTTFALFAVTTPARATIIQWDFFGVGNNVVVGPNDTATVSVAGYFDYDTATDGLAFSLANPFGYQVYENGNLALNCLVQGQCGLTVSNNNTVSAGSPTLPLFTLTAPYSLDGSTPVMPGTGFLFVIASFGTSDTGAFVEARTIPPPVPAVSAVPLPAALPLFGTALAGLGSFGTETAGTSTQRDRRYLQ